ncbi:MAG: DUF2970 domain-containing protein [Pseudomonadota bacterium]|nr:DUF2970 domain-containing protein [Pseudomonadota bacterium]
MGEEKRAMRWWHVVASVLAAMFGVQSEQNRQRDFSEGNPWIFIVTGAMMTLLLILVLWLAVKLILANAGL